MMAYDLQYLIGGFIAFMTAVAVGCLVLFVINEIHWWLHWRKK